MQMELNQLRYFLTVARTGSFVKAAEECGVSQPSLSQQIKKLESDLGAPLFDRLGRGVKLLAVAKHYCLPRGRLSEKPWKRKSCFPACSGTIKAN